MAAPATHNLVSNDRCRNCLCCWNCLCRHPKHETPKHVLALHLRHVDVHLVPVEVGVVGRAHALVEAQRAPGHDAGAVCLAAGGRTNGEWVDGWVGGLTEAAPACSSARAAGRPPQRQQEQPQEQQNTAVRRLRKAGATGLTMMDMRCSEGWRLNRTTSPSVGIEGRGGTESTVRGCLRREGAAAVQGDLGAVPGHTDSACTYCGAVQCSPDRANANKRTCPQLCAQFVTPAPMPPMLNSQASPHACLPLLCRHPATP